MTVVIHAKMISKIAAAKTVLIQAKMISKIAAAKTVWATAAELWIVRLPQTPTVKMAVVKSTASVKSWLISLNP